MIELRDVVVEVDMHHAAQIESWLLGHGRLPKPVRSTGEKQQYLVTNATEFEIADMQLVGAQVRSREDETR